MVCILFIPFWYCDESVLYFFYLIKECFFILICGSVCTVCECGRHSTQVKIRWQRFCQFFSSIKGCKVWVQIVQHPGIHFRLLSWVQRLYWYLVCCSNPPGRVIMKYYSTNLNYNKVRKDKWNILIGITHQPLDLFIHNISRERKESSFFKCWWPVEVNEGELTPGLLIFCSKTRKFSLFSSHVWNTFTESFEKNTTLKPRSPKIMIV